jgi:hypothetical protein
VSGDERDERETRKRARTVILTVAATAPPAVSRLVEAATGTHLGPLPAALVEVGTAGFAIGAVLADRIDTWRSEDERRRRRERAAKRRTKEQQRQADEREAAKRRHSVEPSLQRTGHSAAAEQASVQKQPGYERELWERGRTGPERGLEPKS